MYHHEQSWAGCMMPNRQPSILVLDLNHTAAQACLEVRGDEALQLLHRSRILTLQCRLGIHLAAQSALLVMPSQPQRPQIAHSAALIGLLV